VVVVQGLFEAQRFSAGERVIRMDRQRQSIVAVGAVLQAFEVDAVPAHPHRRRAFPDLSNEVARETLLDIDLDVAVGRIAHERGDVVEQ
jgi:hypothetical protein